ncbi:MPN527 family putative ECF transporter permease subunit [Mycoplasmopsis cricetuli]|uniref:MPN527 family putative ECF transporter permease subunit n=1 Tax=Mycoplasmopsis cricetuli TaxID=171283 RepID=UPI00046F0870|nr:hypothetical protein [Mycoplasmopsis cricetuli]
MKIAKNNSTKHEIFKIALSGVILALALLFDLIGKAFPNIFGFLKLNFSLIPILFGTYLVGKKYGLVILFLNFLIGPVFPDANSIDIRYLGSFAILIVHSVFILTQIGVFSLILKISKNWLELISRKNKFLKYYIVYSISIIVAISITILIISTINTFLINLIYLKLFFKESFSLTVMLEKYSETFKNLFFGIDNYFLGSYTIYIVFNLINLIVNTFIITLIWIIDWKTKFISNFRRKYNHISY